MRKKIFGIATLVLLLLGIVSMIVKTSTKTDTAIEYKQKQVVGNIEKDTVIEYVFTPEDDIVGLKFLVGTYEKKVSRGKLIVRVYDYESGEELVKSDIEANELWDNRFAFADTGLLRTKGRKLRVTVVGREFLKSNGVTLWTGENSLDADGYTRVNGKLSKENLIVTTCYMVKETPYTWELLLLSAIGFLVFIMQWESSKETDSSRGKEENGEQKEDN